MPPECRLLVFSDLDGTLIDHDTYSWQAAKPALMRLKAVSAVVVLASSKTPTEMIAIRADLGLSDWPAIVENGAGLLAGDATDIPDASDYNAIRAAVQALAPDLRAGFCGFGDMDVAQICAATGLDTAAADRARQRCYSEPGLWSGSDAGKAQFLAALAARGISAQQGGRFLTLSFGRNKVDQMRHLIQTLHPDHTVALGDAPNDIAMIEAADFGVIVANPHHAPLPDLAGEAAGRVSRTQAAGPAGWNAAILDLLDRLDLT